MLRQLATNKIYLGITVLFTILTFSQWALRFVKQDQDANSLVNEQYDIELASLNSMDRLSAYIDSLAEIRQISVDNPEKYVRFIDGIIRNRFYHGGSEIDFRDNFIAFLAGKFFWSHLSVGVMPDEILSHANALCSQSAIVFQEIVKKKGFKVRAVGLKRHFCSEVYYEGSWHFVDSDKEPIFDEVQPIPSVEQLSMDEKLIARAYLNDTDNVSLEQLKEIFNGNEILFYNENEFPAKNMRRFQQITQFLSRFLWLILALPVLLWFFVLK